MTTYKLIDSQAATIGQVRRNDGAVILFDPANTDYIAYQAWLAEGNQPLPADEPAQGEQA